MAGGSRRIAIAGVDPMVADLLTDAARRGDGATEFEVVGRTDAMADLPALVDAVAPDVLVAGSADPEHGLPEVCSRFLGTGGRAGVVVLATPGLELAVVYPGAARLERPSPAEILAALASVIAT